LAENLQNAYILELRDKMVKSGAVSSAQGFAHHSIQDEALQALIALGIPRAAAETAIKKSSFNSSEDTLESLIKKSLQLILIRTLPNQRRRKY